MTPAEEIEKWIDDLIFWEGIKDWMYLDSANPANVTTGIGFLISHAGAALKFPWEDSRGKKSSHAEVSEEYNRIVEIGQDYKDGKAMRSAGFYLNPRVSLRFPIEFARKEAARKLTEEFLPAIRTIFPLFESVPPSARAAIVDMAWNLGCYKLQIRFPRFVRAINNNDYGIAANECSRKGRPERNDWAKGKFQKALREWLGRSDEA